MPTSRFWANKEASPKRKYRFRLILPNAGTDSQWMITKVNRPSFNVTEATHSYLNHTFYFPGRVEWQTVSFSIIDPVQPDSTSVLMGIMGAAGYQVPKSPKGNALGSYATMSKEKAVNAMSLVKLQALNAEGDQVDEWTLHNCWMKNVTMGDFDYSDDSLVSMDVELRYDFAIYKAYEGTPGDASKQISDAYSKNSDIGNA
jgi:hypothetical protein